MIAAIDDGDAELSLDELKLLLANLGIPVLGRVLQKRRSPDPATFIGSGKAIEIAAFASKIEIGRAHV